MMARRIPIICTLIASLTLAGFGCKKKITLDPTAAKQTQAQRAAAINRTSNEPETYPPSPDGYIAPEVTYLRQVLKNFAGVSSFRARMVLPTDVGPTTSDLEFDRSKGLHGVMTSANIPSTEIYIIPGEVLFRAGTSTWLNLIYTDEGQQIVNAFASAFSLTGNATSTHISDSARIVSIEEDRAQDCKRHTFSQDAPDGSRQTMFICVKDDLPKISGTVTPFGTMEITYRDYNRPVPIHPPQP